MLWILALMAWLLSAPAQAAEEAEPRAEEQEEAERDRVTSAVAESLSEWWRDWTLKRQAGKPPTVRDISFQEEDIPVRMWPLGLVAEGQRAWRGTSDASIRTAMVQQESPLLTLTDARRVPLDTELLVTDAYRVEIWYAHQGYFDAELLGWEIVEVRPTPPLNGLRPERLKRGAVVEVVGHVDPGPVSTIATVERVGLEDFPSAAVLRSIDSDMEALLGEPFSLDAPEALARSAVETLNNSGFARARATTRIVADADSQEVHVTLLVEPGELCVFGEVEIEGLVDVPREQVEDRITIQAGRKYDPEKLSGTHQAIFALKTFSVVQVIPDLSVEGNVIPVRVIVTETRFRELLVGGGGAAGNGAVELRARSRFRHTNMFGSMLQLDADLTGGYKAYPQAANTTEVLQAVSATQAGPFVQFDADFYYPHLAGNPKLSARPDASVAWVRERNASYKTVELKPGITWAPARSLSLSPSYRYKTIWDLDYVESIPDEIDYLACPADATTDCTYTLQMVQLRMISDRREPIIQPTQGHYVELTVSGAGAGFAGDFDFVRSTVDLRKYGQLRLGPYDRVVLAGRLAGGLAQPYGSDPERAQVPVPERFLLGGGTTVRGFSEDLLGPRSCSSRDTGESIPNCHTPRDRSEVIFTPSGGQAMVYGSLEARVRMTSDFDVVVFSDFGGNWATLDAVALDGIQPTLGTGIRYLTPAGPVRLDFAVRLRDDPDYALDWPFGVHLSIQEAF